MARHPLQAQYERVSRQRALLSAQAVLLGWTKLDTLDAYLTHEDELVVIDKELRRYSTTDEAETLISPDVPVGAEGKAIVTPADVPAAEFGPRWQAMRAKISYALQDDVGALDLSTADRAKALENMELLAASLLRAVQVLREHDGPDWRESIGLDHA